MIAAAGPILFHTETFAVSVSGLPPLAAVALLATGAHISGNKALTLLPSPQVGVICMAEVPAAAPERTESRGSHFRRDYPEEDNKGWLKNIVLKKTDCGLTLETTPVSLDTGKMEPHTNVSVVSRSIN